MYIYIHTHIHTHTHTHTYIYIYMVVSRCRDLCSPSGIGSAALGRSRHLGQVLRSVESRIRLKRGFWVFSGKLLTLR